jgi:hypothetical protein
MNAPKKSELALAIENLTSKAGQAVFKKALEMVPTEPTLLREFALVGSLAMKLGLVHGMSMADAMDWAYGDASRETLRNYAMALIPEMCPFCANPYPTLIIARGGNSRVECGHCGAHSNSFESPPDTLIAVDHIISLLQKWNILSMAARGLDKSSWLPPQSGWISNGHQWSKRPNPDDLNSAG